MDEPRSLVGLLMAECDKKLERQREENRRNRELSTAELLELAPLAMAVIYGERR